MNPTNEELEKLLKERSKQKALARWRKYDATDKGIARKKRYQAKKKEHK